MINITATSLVLLSLAWTAAGFDQAPVAGADAPAATAPTAIDPAPLPPAPVGPPKLFFAGCGTLVMGVECVLFSADAGGVYVLDNLGSFAIGQRVWVSGPIEPLCVTFCQQGDGCIHNDSIAECFDHCGTLVQGVQCILFQPDNWTGPPPGLFILDDLGGFAVGTRVHVVGCPDPACFSFCLQGNGCVNDNLISSCPADLNCDNLVSGLDLALILGQWTGSSLYAPCPPFKPEDLNHDCRINGLDIAIVLGSWGPCPGGSCPGTILPCP